jgi:hypothetical protein
MGIWSRRRFLQSAGITATTGALAALFPLPAAAGEQPKRLILLTSGNGADMTRWKPTGTETTFDLSASSLAAFAPIQDRLLVLDGIDNAAAYHGWGGGHFGMATLWTGASLPTGMAYVCGTNNVGWPQHKSVDRIIAERFATQTRFDAFYWGTWPIARNGDNQGPNGLSHYRDPNDPIEPVLAPDQAFNRLFSGVMGTAEAVAKLREERRSVIDVAKGELSRLRAQLPREDRDRLDAHLAGVRALETQLAELNATCSVPPAPRAFTTAQTRDYSLHPLISRLQFDLMAKALACDLTRVACFDWPHSEMDASWMANEGFSAFGSIHTMAHETTYTEVNGVPVTAAQSRLARQNLHNLTTWRTRTIYQDLWNKLVPDVRERTLLVWSSDMSEPGWHSNRNIPTVLIQGNQFGAFRAGRYLKWGNFNVSAAHAPTNGGPHTSQLCVSLCHAMGLTDITRVGEVSGPAGNGRPAGTLKQGPLMELS